VFIVTLVLMCVSFCNGGREIYHEGMRPCGPVFTVTFSTMP
jgi:hypothetical protein